MSPVHDQSYRRYQGPRRVAGQAWQVMLSRGLRVMLGRKAFVALLVVAWIPFVVRAVQVYAVVTYPQAAQVAPVNARLFQSFVEFQGLFAFFVTVIVGAGLIANDRRANALQVYLSKPMLRLEYVVGKLGVLVVYLAAVTLVPALCLIVLQMAFSGSTAIVTETPRLIPAVLLASALRIIVPSVTMLALSSLSKSARYVAVLYTGVIFVSEALAGILAFVTGSSRLAWLSVQRDFEIVTDALFGETPRYETPVAVALIVLLALVALSASVLERRVKGVEVVA
jgi:ABC-2 type transport system permease protein